MPNYDHTCGKCKKDFVVEMKISEVDNKKVSCPECGSKKVERNVTNNTFGAKASTVTITPKPTTIDSR